MRDARRSRLRLFVYFLAAMAPSCRIVKSRFLLVSYWLAHDCFSSKKVACGRAPIISVHTPDGLSSVRCVQSFRLLPQPLRITHWC